MYTHHRFDHEFPRGTALRTAYLVCAVPRSGSSLLCEHLLLSGVGGAPTEYFDREQLEAFALRWGCGTDPDAFLDALVERKTGPNGVLGMKAHHDQLIGFLGADGLDARFPALRTVLIVRRDRLAQAVSYAIADQTGQWASTHVARSRPRYRSEAVLARLEQVVADEERWRAWLASRGHDPVEVVYEELVADPEATTARVLAALGLGPVPDVPVAAPTLERQATARNRWWAWRVRLRHPRRVRRLVLQGRARARLHSHA